MSLTLIAPPAEEPVSLAELKAHLKIDGADEDALLSGLILAARRTLEAKFGLALVAQTWRLALDAAPAAPVVLSLSPVLSIDSVGAARGGVIEALPSSAYEAVAGAVGRVLIKAPVVSDRALDGAVIVFTAGWANAAAVPEELKLAMKILAAHYYETREGEAEPPNVAPLVAPYRQVRL
ncbi:MAG: phage head-tail connector protein [Parvularculaceae bacterium]|nr:phage head-tail connector protein [Parvularculaceae bacterium]